MAYVTYREGELPANIPDDALCDTCRKAPATRRVLIEGDSRGAEYADFCDSCPDDDDAYWDDSSYDDIDEHVVVDLTAISLSRVCKPFKGRQRGAIAQAIKDSCH